MSEQSMYLEVGAESIFVTHHAPGSSSRTRTAVLLLPPLGWDEMATHRARREWALDLERRGHHVLRIDLPGTADSAGELNVAGRWNTWVDAARAAASWLRAESGATRVAALGLGTGGYLAFEAVAGGDADEAMLWATPSKGKVYLRELKAFGALEAQRVVELGGLPSPEPARGIEAGGNLVQDELAAAIGAVDLETRSLPSTARILIAGRDGAGSSPKLEEALRAQGVDVETTAGRGYATMVVQPDLSVPPRELYAIVADWLERGDAATFPALPSSVRRTSRASVPVDGVLEQPFSIERPSGTLRGVLVEPTAGDVQPLTLVFLNAGAIRRTGPNRLWASWARDWAQRGVPSLRLDNEGIGDADGDGERYRDVGRFHDARLLAHTSAAVDALVEHGLPPRLVAIGLCSGGCWAYQTALANDHVAAAVLLNTRILHWHEHLDPARDARQARLLIRPLAWKRVLRGDVSIRRWRSVAGWMASDAAARLRFRDGAAEGSVFAWQASRAAEGLSWLRDQGKQAHFIFCDGEPLNEELTEAGFFDQPDVWPNVSRRQIPGRDHTLKPIWMHRFAKDAFDAVIESELARTADEIASPA